MMEARRLPHLILLMQPIDLWSQWALLTLTEEGRVLFKKGHDLGQVGEKPKGSHRPITLHCHPVDDHYRALG